MLLKLRIELLDTDNVALQQNSKYFQMKMSEMAQEITLQSSSTAGFEDELRKVREEYMKFKKENMGADTRLKQMKEKLATQTKTQDAHKKELAAARIILAT